MTSNPRNPAQQPAADLQGKSRRSNIWPLIMVSAVVVAAFLIGGPIACVKTTPESNGKEPKANRNAASTETTRPHTSRSIQSSDFLIDDDGKSFWASPTDGGSLDLAYLAPGAQIIVAIRPADLLRNAEGKKVFHALGPIGQQIAAHMESVLPLSPDAIEQLTIGCQPTSEGKWQNTFVVHAAQAIVGEQVLAKLPNAAQRTYKESTYFVTGGMAYFLPVIGPRNILVAASEDLIADIVDLAGQPPALRRDIERLLAGTDSKRDFTVVLAPNVLFSESQNVFAGELAPLRGALFWFLGDEFSGAALSLHWDANFFAEVIATPTLETSPEKAARILVERVHQTPDKLESFVAQRKPRPYGKQLVERLPAMLREFSAYTRSGFGKGQVVLRCYLPPAAGHNLLMASELILAEAASGATAIAESTKPTAPQDAKKTNAGTSGLTKVTSLRFARDTLESALEQLSQDIGVPIVIRGADLQADGITKNQSFGIDVSNKPAADILVEILRLANPDKAATGPHDPRQKLVYIVGPAPDKTEQIVVTTRARAAERHDELPAVFRAEKQ